MEGQIKKFPDKKKLITTKPVLYKMLKGLIEEKKKIKTMNNKMAKNTYLSTIESKKQNKQTRTEAES